MDKDYEDYKNFDMSGAKRGIPPIIKKLQQSNREMNSSIELSDLFENDVIEAIKKHADRPQDIAHMNAVLRALLNTIPTTPST